MRVDITVENDAGVEFSVVMEVRNSDVTELRTDDQVVSTTGIRSNTIVGHACAAMYSLLEAQP